LDLALMPARKQRSLFAMKLERNRCHQSDVRSLLQENQVVIDDRTLAQMNGEYAVPPNAGPAWRAAHEAGLDMSLIEGALELTPEQRLAEHQQVIDFLLEVQAAGKPHAAE
jgi:hypothetical protein